MLGSCRTLKSRLESGVLRFGFALAAVACAALPGCEQRQASGAPESASSGVRGASSIPASVGELRDGDIAFHESTSRQSEMLRALTGSRWTHMGVVFMQGGKPVVLEAVSPVKWTALAAWTARGRGKHYVVKRLRNAEARLTPEVIAKMRQVGTRWLGRPYDSQFRWQDDTLYCSELVYKVYDRGAGIRIGRIERARDMNLDDPRVEAARRQRFAGGRFDPDEQVVTPVSMFEDPQLITVREE